MELVREFLANTEDPKVWHKVKDLGFEAAKQVGASVAATGVIGAIAAGLG